MQPSARNKEQEVNILEARGLNLASAVGFGGGAFPAELRARS